MTIIETLPINLSTKAKKMNFEELIMRLRIEKDGIKYDKKIGSHPVEPKANMVEEGLKTSNKRIHTKDFLSSKILYISLFFKVFE